MLIVLSDILGVSVVQDSVSCGPFDGKPSNNIDLSGPCASFDNLISVSSQQDTTPVYVQTHTVHGLLTAAVVKL